MRANKVVRSAMVAALVRLNAIAAFLAVQRYPSNSSVVAWVLIAYGGLNRFFCADDHYGWMCMYSPDCLYANFVYVTLHRSRWLYCYTLNIVWILLFFVRF